MSKEITKVSAKDLKFIFECAINDRLGYADAYRRADVAIYEEAMQEVKKFRQILKSIFGCDSSLMEDRLTQYANGKKSMSVIDIKKMLNY